MVVVVPMVFVSRVALVIVVVVGVVVAIVVVPSSKKIYLFSSRSIQTSVLLRAF